MKRVAEREEGATVFGYYVKNPEDYGVAEFDEEMNVISIEEKPKHPKSNYAIPGLYFYDNDVVTLAKQIQPSPRGELEITSINQLYLSKGKLKVELLGRGFAWLDTGTHASLNEASSFVQSIEHVQGLKIACPEEIAWCKGWLSSDDLAGIAEAMIKTDYGQYLKSLLEDKTLQLSLKVNR